jgi:hypothetical protein
MLATLVAMVASQVPLATVSNRWPSSLTAMSYAVIAPVGTPSPDVRGAPAEMPDDVRRARRTQPVTLSVGAEGTTVNIVGKRSNWPTWTTWRRGDDGRRGREFSPRVGERG